MRHAHLRPSQEIFAPLPSPAARTAGERLPGAVSQTPPRSAPGPLSAFCGAMPHGELSSFIEKQLKDSDAGASLLEEGLAGRRERRGRKALGLEPPDGKGPLRNPYFRKVCTCLLSTWLRWLVVLAVSSVGVYYYAKGVGSGWAPPRSSLKIWNDQFEDSNTTGGWTTGGVHSSAPVSVEAADTAGWSNESPVSPQDGTSRQHVEGAGLDAAILPAGSLTGAVPSKENVTETESTNHNAGGDTNQDGSAASDGDGALTVTWNSSAANQEVVQSESPEPNENEEGHADGADAAAELVENGQHEAAAGNGSNQESTVDPYTPGTADGAGDGTGAEVAKGQGMSIWRRGRCKDGDEDEKLSGSDSQEGGQGD
eukprot:evm.model.scf_53EXC.2 EVM.evm.TU.scf_53EXC.2   scf_53EXC:26661-31488(-)